MYIQSSTLLLDTNSVGKLVMPIFKVPPIPVVPVAILRNPIKNVCMQRCIHKTLERLIVSLIYLESGNFNNFNVYGRRKHARFCELSLKIYEMKIQPVS